MLCLNTYGLLALWWWNRKRVAQNRRRRRRWWVRPTFSNRKESGAFHVLIPRMLNLDSELFINYLRMTPEIFEDLLNLVGPHFQKFSVREPISPRERLTATLRYLASGDSMKFISYQFRISPSTVSGIILETCNCIWEQLKDVAFAPLSESTFESVANQFWDRSNFPNCVGAIDGKHVVCQAFAKSGSEFFNYKNTFSIVLLGVASPDYRFLFVDIGCPERISDGGVLRRSAFGQALSGNSLDLPPPKMLPSSEEMLPHVFVADEAFPLTTAIMRPYPGKFLPDEQLIFNYRKSRARMCVENSFCILPAKWRIYRKTILFEEKKVRAIVKSTVCLHNWLLKIDYGVRPHDRRYPSTNYGDIHTANGEYVSGRWRAGVTEADAIRDLYVRLGSNRHAQTATDIREKLTDYFLGPGQVDCQWKRIPRREDE